MKVAGRLADEDHVATFLDDFIVVRNGLVGVLVLQLGTCFLWWLSLTFGNLQDQQALSVANESYGPMFWGVGICIGIILPLGLGTIAVLRGEAVHRRLEITVIGLTSFLILVGGYFFRLAYLLGGQIALPVNLF